MVRKGGLMEQMFKVTINDVTKEYPSGTTYMEIAEEWQDKFNGEILLVNVDGRLRELHKTLKKDCEISFITIRDQIGFNSYSRSACMLLLKAIFDISGKDVVNKVMLHYSMGPGLFFSIRGQEKVEQEYLDQVQAKMQELTAKKIPYMKKSVTTDEACEMFTKHQMLDKAQLFHYRRSSRVNVYSLERFRDYYFGFMVQHTGYVNCYQLISFKDGFILQLPVRNDPGVIPEFKPSEKVFNIMRETERWSERMNLSTVGELNARVTKGGLQQLILVQEALQEAKIAEIAEQICKAGDKKFIMIAGPSSSGKTTFSHRLSIQLEAHGKKPHPIALDNYFVNREQTPVDEFGEKDYECLEAIDVEQFNKDMLDLMEGKCVEMPEYNFVSGKREYKGDFLQLHDEDILVIEGIHGLNDKLSYALPKESKFKIYISALTTLNIDEHNRIPTTDGRLIRRMVRDARTRGTSAAETIAMWQSVRRGEEKNIFPFQEEADAMFNSAILYELSCLKVYAEPLLFGISKDSPSYIEAKRLLKFLDYFLPMPSDMAPNNSIIREFVGGSCFKV